MSNAKVILVADDSLTIRKLVETVLTEEGYQVASATTGAECLKLAAEQKPNLILLDYILPDMQGTEICHNLINSPETWEIPVLMMSSNGNAIRQLYQDLNNVADYLTKPFAPSVLKAVVGHLLQPEKQTSAAAAPAEAPALAQAGAAAEAMPKDFLDKVTRLLDLMENQPRPATAAAEAPANGDAAAPAPKAKARRTRKKPVASAPVSSSVARKFRLALQKHLRARVRSIPEWECGRENQDPEEFFLGRLLAKEVLSDLGADLVRATGMAPESAEALHCPAGLVPIDAVLHFLHSSRATGELRIDTGEETVLACLEQGQVVLLTSNHPRNYCAGAACDFQAVPHAILSEAVRAQEEQSLPFFVSLKNADCLPAQASLGDLLRQQGENCLLRAFKSPRSVASFFPVTRLSALARSCKIDFSFNRLLLACYRTVDDWFTLEQVIPDLDVTVIPMPDLDSQAVYLSLDAEEAMVLNALRGGRTVPELAASLDRKPFEICRILYRFIKLNLIQPGPRVHAPRVAKETHAAFEPAPVVTESAPAPVAEIAQADAAPTVTETPAPVAAEASAAVEVPAAEPIAVPALSEAETNHLDVAEHEPHTSATPIPTPELANQTT